MMLQAGRTECRPNAQRRLRRDSFGDGHGPLQLPPRFGHLLDQPHAEGFRGAELIRRQQVAHGVAPPGFADQTKRRAAQRVQSAGDFQLCETCVAGGDADVGGFSINSMPMVNVMPCTAITRGFDKWLRMPNGSI